MSPRAPAAAGAGVSRSGETPEPTVTVRMEENGTLPGFLVAWTREDAHRFPLSP